MTTVASSTYTVEMGTRTTAASKQDGVLPAPSSKLELLNLHYLSLLKSPPATLRALAQQKMDLDRWRRTFPLQAEFGRKGGFRGASKCGTVLGLLSMVLNFTGCGLGISVGLVGLNVPVGFAVCFALCSQVPSFCTWFGFTTDKELSNLYTYYSWEELTKKSMQHKNRFGSLQ